MYAGCANAEGDITNSITWRLTDHVVFVDRDQQQKIPRVQDRNGGPERPSGLRQCHSRGLGVIATPSRPCPLTFPTRRKNYVRVVSANAHVFQDDATSVGPSGAPTSSHQMGIRGNVLNRVGHQQDKWKRQVREQRKNIYDKHTMLN
ncbi:unnamed protein product [Nesidiocoris tenuis]|uniref:Uncharacterized protein n=1 Tax=Nesidiocoris tenuis TaxID=355587 RepID=A0A6H5GGG0_9HEMI|nr:unnamed protein product [Nesidiocoris tenuis]